MNIISNNTMKATIALAALEAVMDPEIGLNVVDLGLIYQLDFSEEDKEIFVSMTLTTQFCPMGESIADGVKQCLETTFGDMQVKVDLVFDPPWNYEKISEAGKAYLNRP